jgi:hypothetical protein
LARAFWAGESRAKRLDRCFFLLGRL